MAKDKDKGAESKKPATAKKGEGGGRKHPFAAGLIAGLLAGLIIGWWVSPKPPAPVDKVRRGTETQLTEAAEVSREKLADFADNVSGKLRRD